MAQAAISRIRKLENLRGFLRYVDKNEALRLPSSDLKVLVKDATKFFGIARKILIDPDSSIGDVLETSMQMEICITNIYGKGLEGKGYAMAFFGMYEGTINKSPHFGE